VSRAILAAAVLLAGCSTAALDGGAILRHTCAPNDAGAVLLIVPASSSAYPQLRVVVWRSEVAGTTVTVPGDGGQNGNALWCTADGSCQEVTTATAAFGQSRADGSMDVLVDARLPDGSRFREARRAQWQAVPTILCG
jgi:hypothetical protein